MARPPCDHTPPCPPSGAQDHDAARLIFHDSIAGYSLLCNGVIVFEDGGELTPSGGVLPEQRGPAPHTTTLAPVTA